MASSRDIVIRPGETSQLVLRPEIVESAANPEAGVKAKLLYQKKSTKESWTDVDPINLSSLKVGDSVAIQMRSEELLKLRNGLNDLQAIKDEWGVPSVDTKFISLRQGHWSSGEEKGKTVVTLPQGVTGSDLGPTLSALLERDDLSALLNALATDSPDLLQKLRSESTLSTLEQLLLEWDQDPNNPSEEHWQKLFTKFPFAIEQLFYSPTVIIQEKAYLGGKLIGNDHGKLADFLCGSKMTGSAVIVEIKTPKSSLLPARHYRTDIWPAHIDLSGSIVQVLTYRDTLMEAMPVVARDTNLLHTVSPRCGVIIGHSSTLDCAEKKRSFERIRGRQDVVILTYDEVRTRLERLRDIMR